MTTDYGTFTGLVKTAGFLISATVALGLSWRGRAKWEPSEQDVPQGPQRVAGLITAVTLALLWSLVANTQHIPVLVKIAVFTALTCLVSLLVYGYVVAVQTYDGKAGKKIIGGFRLSREAKRAIASSEGTLTVQKFLKSVSYDPDRAWSRHTRALAKSLFSICYIALTSCGTIALACASMIVLFRPSEVPVEPSDKKPIQIGIVLTGQIYFTREIMASFTQELDAMLRPTAYAANYEFVVGEPDASRDTANQRIFESLLDKFPQRRVDYLVTIGTQASEYAHTHYRGRFPLVFVAVTDPVKSGLVRHFGRDPTRGNVAGVIYGLPVKTYLRFFQEAFPGKTFGFVYNPNYHQDVYLLQNVLQAAPTLTPPLRVRAVAVAQPRLSEAQQDDADIFFGRYYVAANLGEFVEHSSKPFVAGDISNITKGAVACIAPSSTELGIMTARQVVFRNLVNGVALADMPIIGPTKPVTAVNLSVARHYGISISKAVIDRANRRVD